MAKTNGRPEIEKPLDIDHELPAGDGDENTSAAPSLATDADFLKLQAERDSLLDRLARMQAEFENARRRTVKEQQDYRDYAAADAIRSLLPVLDSFERA